MLCCEGDVVGPSDDATTADELKTETEATSEMRSSGCARGQHVFVFTNNSRQNYLTRDVKMLAVNINNIL